MSTYLRRRRQEKSSEETLDPPPRASSPPLYSPISTTTSLGKNGTFPQFLLSSAFLLGICILHLSVAPYTKVEESFGLQACHDLYYAGFPRSDADLLAYDHIRYPGVVPRSFSGPALLTFLSRLLFLPCPSPPDPATVQLIHRATLACLNVFSLMTLARTAAHSLGDPADPRPRYDVAAGSLLVASCQFHLPYYASRTLPNVLALPWVTLAWSEWLRGRGCRAVFLLSAAAAVLRCDLVILVAAAGAVLLLTRRIGVGEGILSGTGGVCAAVLLTVPVDTRLWAPVHGASDGRPFVWPELLVLKFNAVDNRSAEYGTEPWHWYLTSALPKMLLLAAPLVPLGLLCLQERAPASLSLRWDARVLPLAAAAAVYVVIYSLLPHKETRFLFPVLPLLDLLAGKGLANLRRAAWVDRRIHVRGAYALGILGLMVSGVASSLFVHLSSFNYPGGEGVESLRRHLGERIVGIGGGDESAVLVDVLAAGTGVTLFQTRAAQEELARRGWKVQFDVEGYEEENRGEARVAESVRQHQFLLTEKDAVEGYHVIDVVHGYAGMDYRQFKIKTTEKLYLLEQDSVDAMTDAYIERLEKSQNRQQ